MGEFKAMSNEVERIMVGPMQEERKLDFVKRVIGCASVERTIRDISIALCVLGKQERSSWKRG